jgi:hypothetical protein
MQSKFTLQQQQQQWQVAAKKRKLSSQNVAEARREHEGQLLNM